MLQTRGMSLANVQQCKEVFLFLLMSQTKKVCLQICKFSAQCPYFDETLGFAGFAHIVLQNF